MSGREYAIRIIQNAVNKYGWFDTIWVAKSRRDVISRLHGGEKYTVYKFNNRWCIMKRSDYLEYVRPYKFT